MNGNSEISGKELVLVEVPGKKLSGLWSIYRTKQSMVSLKISVLELTISNNL